MINLKGYRSKAQGLPDLLPFAGLVDNGVMLNKDGSFMAAWECRGMDAASSTVWELDEVAERFNHAMVESGTGLVLHLDSVRMPTSRYSAPHLSHFPDSISQLIENERRTFFEDGKNVYQTHTILTAVYKIPDDESRGVNLDKAILLFNEKIEKLEVVLQTLPDFFLGRLVDFEVENEFGHKERFSPLLSHLHLAISGNFQPIKIPETPMCMDVVLGGHDLQSGFVPKIGDNFIKIIAIDSFPGYSYPAMLQFLDSLPIEHRFSTRFICLDRLDALKFIETEQKGWNQLSVRLIDKYTNNPNPKINRYALAMFHDSQDAYDGVQDQVFGVGFYTANIILMSQNEDELKKYLKALTGELNVLGFVPRIEKENALEAWKGSIPGNTFSNVRRPLINTIALAHLLPLVSVWPGEENCPCPFYPKGSPALMVCTTDLSTPFRFNIHDGDIGHTLIFGPTGSGKSTLIGLIVAQFLRYQNAQIFAFDKGMSLFPLTAACKGKHFDVGEGGLSFAPFQFLGESEEEFAWAYTWVETLLFLRMNKELTPQQSAALTDALRDLTGDAPENRNMNLLRIFLHDAELQEALKYYCGEIGACGEMWEAPNDSFGISRFMTFEMESIMNQGEKRVLPVLLYLFHRIEREFKGKPSLLILDEAWLMLGHEIFKEKIREWLKVLRKANCAVVLATQSLSDATRSGIMDVLAESCPTKIFLSNFTANQDHQAPQYTALGLNERGIDIITEAEKKQDYYIVSPCGKRLVQLAVGKKALSFVGASSKEDIARIKSLQTKHGELWPAEWLLERSAITQAEYDNLIKEIIL